MALNIFHVTNGILGRKDIVTFAKLVSMKEKTLQSSHICAEHNPWCPIIYSNLAFGLQQVKDVIAMQAISFSNMF